MFTDIEVPTRASLVVGLLLFGGTAWAEPGPQGEVLTLEGAVSTARQNNRLGEAARLRIGETRGDLEGASLLLAENPEFSVESGPRISRGGAGETTVDLGVGLEQQFETGGQRAHRMDRARAMIAATTVAADDVLRVIDLAVAHTFYSAQASEIRVRLNEQNAGLARGLHDIAKRRLDAGAGTPLEVSAARIRLAEAQRKTIATRAQSQAAAVRLGQLLGIARPTSFALEGDLPEDEAAPTAEVLVAGALRARPDLTASRDRVDAARAAVSLADAEAWPDIRGQVFYSREEGDQVVTAGVRVPIPLFNRNDGEKQSTRARQARLEAERAALRLSVESEVRRRLLAYEHARSALRLYDAEVLRALEESLGLIRRALDAGEVGIPDLIVVQRELLEGREGHLDVRLQLAHARAELLASAAIPQTSKLHRDTP